MNIQATSVLLQFIPGFNGHTSISKWVVQAQVRGAGATEGQEGEDWEVVFEASAPDANSLIVTGLTPYTTYRYAVGTDVKDYRVNERILDADVFTWFSTHLFAICQRYIYLQTFFMYLLLNLMVKETERRVQNSQCVSIAVLKADSI